MYQSDTVPESHAAHSTPDETPPAAAVPGYDTVLGAIGHQGGSSAIEECTSAANPDDYEHAFKQCIAACHKDCEQHKGCLSFAVLHPRAT